MARKIASRMLISGKLVACGPLHVGGIEGNADVDLALATNGSGQLYVPGTSLAGPMRAWLRQQASEESVQPIWGFQDETKSDKKQGHASFVIVEDGLVNLPPGGTVETRDGVGIDRVLGAAADRIKYNRAVLPAGTEITLGITVELGDANKAARESILATLHALKRGKIRLGGAKTRGLGKVMLKDLSVSEQELNSFCGMLRTLRKEGRALDIGKMLAPSLSVASALDIRIGWRPRGPVIVKAEHGGVAVDILPLVSARGSDLTFVLPGGSIKGALRSRAERIVRTVCGLSAPMIEGTREGFVRQIEMSDRRNENKSENAAMHLIGGLFGLRAKARAGDEKISDDGPPLLGLGALTIEDCYALPRFTQQQWATIESASDFGAEDQAIDGPNSPLRNALRNAGLANMQQAFHVAIDRWTGGAADGFLYTVLEPHSVAWEPIRMTLDLSRLRSVDQPPTLMCLLLTLRDFVNGRIPLGFGTNRGLGSIEVTAVEFTSDGNNPTWDALKDVQLVDGKLGGWSEQLKGVLEGSWSTWKNSAERK